MSSLLSALQLGSAVLCTSFAIGATFMGLRAERERRRYCERTRDFEREASALRAVLFAMVGYTFRIEEFCDCDPCLRLKFLEIVNSRPPIADLLMAVQHRNWDVVERMKKGEAFEGGEKWWPDR